VRTKFGVETGRRHAFRTPVRYDAVRRLIGSLAWAGTKAVKNTPSRAAFAEPMRVLDLSDLLDVGPVKPYR
jgi:hypothetical protein